MNANHPSNTPWGKPDHIKVKAPGIVWYSTPSHGGFWLSPERVDQLPPALAAVKPWAGPGWYEEDCDWSIVALAFPGLFAQDLDAARATLKCFHPAAFAALEKHKADPGRDPFSSSYRGSDFS